MTELTDFIGTWRASDGPPFSAHTFIWEHTGRGLRGRWFIEPSGPLPVHDAADTGRPRRIELQIGEPWLEDGVLLFHVNGGPFPTEFRLVGDDHASVGASVERLPPALAGPEASPSIERHRVRLTRQPVTAGETGVEPQLEITWHLAEGGTAPAGAAGARVVDVAAGLQVAVEFRVWASAGIVVDLALSGERPVSEDGPPAPVRFVAIPLDASSLIVAIAAPSADPVLLMPVPSTPAWAGVGGFPIPPSARTLSARRPQGAELVLEIVPAPHEMSVCAVRVSSVRAARPPRKGAEGPTALSLLRLAPQHASILAAPGDADEHAGMNHG